jgi:hypothetical protein
LGAGWFDRISVVSDDSARRDHNLGVWLREVRNGGKGAAWMEEVDGTDSAKRDESMDESVRRGWIFGLFSLRIDGADLDELS